MSVDVVYQGLTIARDAATRIAGREIFIETEGPMPVATAVTVAHGGHALPGRVARVVEGVGAGMAIVPVAEGGLPAWLTQLRSPAQETVTMEAEPEAPAPVAAAPEPVAAAPAPVAPPPPAPEVREMVAELPPAEAALPAVPEAAAAPVAVSPPVFESTVELAIPSLNDGDGEGDTAAAGDKKSSSSRNKKKSSSRRR